MNFQEKIKYLWNNKEFEQAYNLTQDTKIKDLIDWINKQGGIDNVPQGVIFSIIIDNSYLYYQLLELELKGTKEDILKPQKQTRTKEKKKNEI